MILHNKDRGIAAAAKLCETNDRAGVFARPVSKGEKIVMAKNRIGRINEEIQKELSSLLRTLKDPRLQNGLLTVTHVETTPDLRFSKIFVSALDKGQEADMMKGLKSASGYLRRELGVALKLRYTPELQFVADDSILQGAHILEMLRNPEIVKPANPANEHIVLDEE